MPESYSTSPRTSTPNGPVTTGADGHPPTDRQISGWLPRLIDLGSTVELRAPKLSTPGRKRLTNAFKRFKVDRDEDYLAVARAALEFSGRAPGVYFTLNPLLDEIDPRKAATDADIEQRHRLLIDCDPDRPADTSSTDAEKAAALELAMTVREHLDACGWTPPILADSGNGYHLLYKIRVAAEDGGLIKATLEALAARFDTDSCKIDRKVFNASRICKFYGTESRKGESTPERPHRYSFVLEIPDHYDRYIVGEDQLHAIADDRPAATPTLDLDGEIERKRTQVPPRANGTGKGNRPDPESRALAYLERCDPAISGQNGHGKAFKAACKIGPGFDLTPEVTLRLIRDHYNPRCVPPWSDKELQHKVSDAYKVETRRGWLLEANRNGTGEKPTTTGTAPRNGAAEGGFVGSVGDSPPISPEFRGGLKPLKGELPKVHPLPQALIPSPLRGWLSDIARRGCFPIEYPVAAALVALSILLGRNLTIRPKRQDAWTVIPNLWGAIVGPPGLQKTPAVAETFLPLRRLVAEAIESHAEAERLALEDAAIAEAKASAAKKKLAEAAKKGAPDSELRRLVAEANGPGETGPPAAKRYMVNDATVEKLGELLRENPRGLLQFRDELTGFFRSMDRQGHESDRGFYLETWDGDGSYTFDRIARGTVHVAALCLSIFGTIQPGPLARYLKGAATGEDADGFVPRFQVLMYPDPPDRFINVDEWPDVDAKNEAYEVFRRIDSIDPAALGAEFDEDRGLYFLRFDDAAQDLFDEWRGDLENRLRGGGESAMMACHLAKYRSLMPSLALLFHVVASVGGDRLGPVTHQAAEAAAAWCEVLESHARRVYLSAIDGDPEVAARLGERIKQSLPNPFTFRHVANKGWAGLDTVEDVRKAVGILEDRNWVKVVVKPPGPSGGRPSEEVWVNPDVAGPKEAES